MVSIIPYSLGHDAIVAYFTGGTFKVMVLKNTYTPSKSHTKRSDWTAHEVSGTGYTAGGKTIAVTSVTRSTSTTSVAWATTTWPSANGFTGRYGGIYYAHGGADTGDEIVGLIDHGGDVAAAGGDYVLTIPNPLQFIVP